MPAVFTTLDEKMLLEDLINPHDSELCAILCRSINGDIRILNHKIGLLTLLVNGSTELRDQEAVYR